MAEARRTEDEEENMRDQVVRRQPRPNSSGGRPDRHKPEHRHSHGPLSSIRAVIKRTSTRSSSLSETSRERDRRRPEITILSAEPLASISGFPGASGGIPPPPPPSALWGATIPPSSLQPPPSYEEVIREKSQEQVLLPPPSSSSHCSVSKTTIATQTDTGSAPKLRPAPPKPVKPARPSFPCAPEPSHVDDIATSTGQSSLISLSEFLGANAHAESERTLHTQPSSSHTHSAINTHSSSDTHCSTHTQPSTNTSPLSSTSSAQTDQWEPFSAAEVVAVATPPTDPAVTPLERPRPRPRSKASLRPISREVKVQTLVKLRADGLATLAAARKGSDLTKQEVSQGKYLQELLDAFSSDDWGFPDHRSDGSGLSQSDSEEEEDDEEMGTLKARILAFEQQQQSADVGCGDGNHGDRGAASEVFEEVAVPKRPEPRPRPRLQGQLPTKPGPPTVAPKPRPSCKGLWEEGSSPASGSDSGVTETPKTSDASTLNLNSAPQLLTDSACSSPPNPDPVLASEPPETSEKPSVLPPKPPPPSETLLSNVPAPVPAPRPPPPKATPSPSDSSSNPSTPTSHRPPPRPTVAPRASVGASNREKSTVAGPVSPALPPRPSVEVGGDAGDGAETQADAQRPDSNAETTHASNIQAVKTGSGRPVLPVKPPTLTLPRRASAPSLAPKPSGPPPDPVAPKPPPTTQTGPPKPPTGPTKPPAPTVAQRKAPAVAQTKAAEPSLPPRPAGAKFLPLRPPPIKNIPGRPPPPTVTSTLSSTTNPVPPSKLSSTPPPSSAEQPPPPIKDSPAPSPTPSSQTPPPSKDSPAPSPTPSIQTPPPSKNSPTPSPTPSNQTQGQKTLKRGPPLPPRPKPGHALYSSYGTPQKEEVLVVLDDPSPAPSEPILSEGSSQNTVTPLIDQSQSLLDLEIQPEPLPDQKDQSKMAPESLSLSESQSILPEHPAGQKQQPDTTPESGPRCVAKFDYEGEEDDELTFSQGDVITLLELIGEEWARGQIHGRIGIFPLNFAEVVEPLPLQTPSPGETTNDTPTQEEAGPAVCQSKSSEKEEWAEALFDFPGQTAGDLSFHKGALINVIQHLDAEWRRGRVDGKEGLYPVAFTQPYTAQPIVGQQSEVKGVAKALFDFTAESDDELTLKVGDILTEVELVDEKWIKGAVGGRRGIVPKNYISLQ